MVCSKIKAQSIPLKILRVERVNGNMWSIIVNHFTPIRPIWYVLDQGLDYTILNTWCCKGKMSKYEIKTIIQTSVYALTW